MGRHAQLVIGPAGAGKSTYCQLIQTHCAARERLARVVNLDPAAESFSYDVAVDVRDLITVENVMEATELGPNGGLVYCMEYLMENLDWLGDQMDAAGGSDDEYFLIDCPGQIELFTHIPVVKQVCKALHGWGFKTCAVYLIDALFVDSIPKYLSGVMIALATMVNLEIAHINVLSKCDLADMAIIEKYLMPDTFHLRGAIEEMRSSSESRRLITDKYSGLNNAFCELLDSYNMVRFIPLNPSDQDSLEVVLAHVDNAMQYGEDVEPKEPPTREEE